MQLGLSSGVREVRAMKLLKLSSIAALFGVLVFPLESSALKLTRVTGIGATIPGSSDIVSGVGLPVVNTNGQIAAAVQIMDGSSGATKENVLRVEPSGSIVRMFLPSESIFNSAYWGLANVGITSSGGIALLARTSAGGTSIYPNALMFKGDPTSGRSVINLDFEYTPPDMRTSESSGVFTFFAAKNLLGGDGKFYSAHFAGASVSPVSAPQTTSGNQHVVPDNSGRIVRQRPYTVTAPPPLNNYGSWGIFFGDNDSEKIITQEDPVPGVSGKRFKFSSSVLFTVLDDDSILFEGNLCPLTSDNNTPPHVDPGCEPPSTDRGLWVVKQGQVPTKILGYSDFLPVADVVNIRFIAGRRSGSSTFILVKASVNATDGSIKEAILHVKKEDGSAPVVQRVIREGACLDGSVAGASEFTTQALDAQGNAVLWVPLSETGSQIYKTEPGDPVDQCDNNLRPQPTAEPISTLINQSKSTRVFPNDPNIAQAHTFRVLPRQIGFLTRGEATIDQNGVLTYTPDRDEVGEDRIQVEVKDNGVPPLSTTIVVDVTISEELKPVARITGPSSTIYGSLVDFDGSNSVGSVPGALIYNWTIRGPGGNIVSTGNSARISFNPPTPTTERGFKTGLAYTVHLKVTDGAKESAEVTKELKVDDEAIHVKAKDLKQFARSVRHERTDHSENSIGSTGCKVSVKAMVFDALGLKLRDPISGKIIPTTVSNMNRMLSRYPGMFDARRNLNDDVFKDFFLPRYGIDFDKKEYNQNDASHLQAIEDNLKKGLPVELEIPGSPKHFVMAVGVAYKGPIVGPPLKKFIVNDPGSGNRERRYVNPATIKRYILYKKNPSLRNQLHEKSFHLTTAGEVEIMIQDPNGKRFGIDPASGNFVDNFINADYSIESVDDSDLSDGNTPTEPSLFASIWDEAVEGTYQVTIKAGASPVKDQLSVGWDINGEDQFEAKFLSFNLSPGQSTTISIPVSFDFAHAGTISNFTAKLENGHYLLKGKFEPEAQSDGFSLPTEEVSLIVDGNAYFETIPSGQFVIPSEGGFLYESATSSGIKKFRVFPDNRFEIEIVGSSLSAVDPALKESVVWMKLGNDSFTGYEERKERRVSRPLRLPKEPLTISIHEKGVVPVEVESTPSSGYRWRIVALLDGEEIAYQALSDKLGAIALPRFKEAGEHFLEVRVLYEDQEVDELEALIQRNELEIASLTRELSKETNLKKIEIAISLLDRVTRENAAADEKIRNLQRNVGDSAVMKVVVE